jgi:hypothetical protein
MTRTLNQIIFFFLHQNQNIFLEENHNPPPFKLNGRSLTTWYKKIKQLRNVEKTTLLNDKIPSKSNYENISPKMQSQMNS